MGFIRIVEFVARVRRQVDQVDQARAALGVAKHPKQVHDVAIEIVVNLGVNPLLLEQNTCGATKWLNVATMRREVSDDPRGKAPFRAVVAD
ncbi:hypothetical protein D3C72_1976000 [compost metagenome]